MRQDNRRFRRGSGTYVCERCGKRTRETGSHESDYRLCRDCLDHEHRMNNHLDYHDVPEPGCPFCEAKTEASQ